MKREQNERLTRIGPGTAMGETFRRYWLPFALVEELPAPDCPPIRVRLLGEDLVAFRSSDGAVGLVDAYCPHRRAPMFFGRNEDCGLRCVYHGWKFDTDGRCVDLPSQSADSRLRDRVRILAYPTVEGGGMVWAYLGPPDRQPPPPDYELMRTPATHRRVSKTFEACNYLQALEGGLDTTHSAFVHNIDINSTELLHTRDTHPRLDVEVTDYGYRYAGLRRLDDDRDRVRVTHYLMPVQQMRGTYLDFKGERPAVPTVNGHIWVPVDDVTTCVYNWMQSADADVPVTDEHWESYETMFGRGPDDLIEGTWWLRRNLANDYLIDREVQRTTSFTGIEGIQTQDYALQEGMGPIVDRTKEILGTSDKAIIAARRLLLEAADAVAAGETPKGVDPAPIRSIRPADSILPRSLPWREGTADEVVACW